MVDVGPLNTVMDQWTRYPLWIMDHSTVPVVDDGLVNTVLVVGNEPVNTVPVVDDGQADMGCYL